MKNFSNVIDKWRYTDRVHSYNKLPCLFYENHFFLLHTKNVLKLLQSMGMYELRDELIHVNTQFKKWNFMGVMIYQNNSIYKIGNWSP